MGRYLRKCKRLGEGVIMEKAAETTAGRKRKIGLEESESSASSVDQQKARRLAVVISENSASSASSGNSTCDSIGTDHVSASCCSSNGSSELAEGSSKCVDLEETEVTVELFPILAGHSLDCTERKGATPLREVRAESGEQESTDRPRELSYPRRSRVEKMPSEAEIEEFFAVAEKNLQKQFIDKYNYDIAKDQPLEGRFEWIQIQLKP